LVFLAAGSIWAVEMSGVQGEVKGPDAKPISGADVRAQNRDSKAVAGTAKTDAKGSYVIKNLAPGNYNITVTAAGMATTAATNVQIKPRNDRAIRMDFDLKRQIAGAAANVPPTPKKKAKRMVWVASETGTNLGGRWVEVDDGGNPEASSLNVKRAGAGAVSSIQAGGGTAKGGN
jgi:hypothetical protein